MYLDLEDGALCGRRGRQVEVPLPQSLRITLEVWEQCPMATVVGALKLRKDPRLDRWWDNKCTEWQRDRSTSSPFLGGEKGCETITARWVRRT